MRLILIFITLLLVGGCGKDEWKGFVYPDKDHLSHSIPTGTHNSLEECRAASLKIINIGSYDHADYECGLNCKFNKDMSVNVCKETVK